MERWTVLAARAVLLALCLISFVGVWQYTAYLKPPPRDEQAQIGDTELQLRTIERIRQGEAFYDAVGEELRHNDYPTWPLMNWRTPLHYRAVAALSVERAGILLTLLGMAAIVTAGLAYLNQGLCRALLGGALMLLAMAPGLLVRPGSVVYPEHWSDVLVALSLNAYVARLWTTGAALGILAVFVRELAVPYALICGWLAFRARRRRELTLWVVGGVGYTLYYLLHAFSAMSSIEPGDLVRDQSYVQFLGLRFVLMTLHTFGGLLILPAFVTPLAASAGLASAWAPRAPAQLRISVPAYFLLFLVVGQPFNFYWGFSTSGLWAHAFVHAGAGMTALLVASGILRSRADAGGACEGPLACVSRREPVARTSSVP